MIKEIDPVASSGVSAAMPMQDEIIAFLSDPKTHSGEEQEVTCINTHGAVIFLAGEFAYKIKRAVKLNYLDYSSLDKREKMCRLEFLINRRTAPEIYIEVLPINRTINNGLSLGGRGVTVEWAIKMHRFSQENLLSNIAMSGGLTDNLITQLAEMIAKYHHASAPAPGGNCLNGVQKLQQIVTSLNSSFNGAPKEFIREFAETYHSNLSAAMEQNRSVVLERERLGFSRRCHGDMHLQNIVFLSGQPKLFDAIEFDDDIATIDILYDLAFLLMDLWFHGLHDQANLLFNEYLRCLDDEQNLRGLAIMPMYISMRAAIRAMVGIDRMAQIDEKERNDNYATIRDYLTLAKSALKTNHPSLILIGGRSGTGKSTMGRAISSSIPPLPGAVHLRSDVERKTMFDVGPQIRLPEECYTEHYSDEVYKILLRKASNILDSGHSVIVDAVFLSQSHRVMFEELAEGRAIDLKPIWLDAHHDALQARVEARQNDASDAGRTVVKKQFDVKSEPKNWINIDAGSEPKIVKDRICEALNINTVL